MPTKTNAKPRRTKRACAQRARKLKRSGDPKAASRLARYCPPPGRRKANEARRGVEVVQVDAARGGRGLVVYLTVPREGRSVMVGVRASASGRLTLPSSIKSAAERRSIEAAAKRAVEARLRLESSARAMPQMTMADVRRVDPGHFRDTSPYGGGYPGSKFFGPYTGPNGTYFVQEYPTPSQFRSADGPTSWAISRVGEHGVDRTDIDTYRTRADAIRFARDLAIGD